MKNVLSSCRYLEMKSMCLSHHLAGMMGDLSPSNWITPSNPTLWKGTWPPQTVTVQDQFFWWTGPGVFSEGHSFRSHESCGPFTLCRLEVTLCSGQPIKSATRWCRFACDIVELPGLVTLLTPNRGEWSSCLVHTWKKVRSAVCIMSLTHRLKLVSKCLVLLWEEYLSKGIWGKNVL